jgi:hypothetical protein
VKKILLVAFLVPFLAACGEKSDKPGSTVPAGAAQEGAAGARAVVEAYFASAKFGGGDQMLALGTPEWREKERSSGKAFTSIIANGSYSVKSREIRDPAVEGDVARVSARVVLVDREGKDDPEGMNFTLKRADGRWWITDLR